MLILLAFCGVKTPASPDVSFSAACGALTLQGFQDPIEDSKPFHG
jgi:hypothetical protein